MRTTATRLFALSLALCLQATVSAATVTDLEPESYFDFWLGTWDLRWEQADGTTGQGTNRIERVLDGKVIQENFEAHSGALAGFEGRSHSVYQPRTGTWQQTWVDNRGGYLDFTGELDGETRIFKRQGTNPQGETILQRMRFYDIEPDALTWDWEVSEDGGETWQLRWRIFYARQDASSESQE